MKCLFMFDKDKETLTEMNDDKLFLVDFKDKLINILMIFIKIK
jgi:hypothetical protein